MREYKIIKYEEDHAYYGLILDKGKKAHYNYVVMPYSIPLLVVMFSETNRNEYRAICGFRIKV